MSAARQEAWAELVGASGEGKERDYDKASAARLSNAAKAWAAANGYVLAVGGAALPPALTSNNSSGAVFPNYGRSKGQPVAGASRQDLEFYAAGCRRTLANPEKARWHEKERALLAAIDAELAK